jgi:hypothetical protein
LMSTDPFKKSEDEYFRLRGQFGAGRITREEFERALHDLIVQDAEGRYWMLGPDSGKWYIHKGKDWVEEQPPGMSSGAVIPSAQQSVTRSRTPMLPIFAISGMGLVCLCGIVALLLASTSGILKISLGPFGAPTQTPFRTFTPFIAPTLTHSPTATAQPSNTPTASPVPTVTPTPTITPQPEGNCSDPNARWENVTDGQTIEPIHVFVGTATSENFAGYVVEWLRPGNVLHKSTTSVVHGVLFTWNTYTVQNGEYPVALIVVRQDGSTLAPCVIRVQIVH